jgi:hypothetical protein
MTRASLLCLCFLVAAGCGTPSPPVPTAPTPSATPAPSAEPAPAPSDEAVPASSAAEDAGTPDEPSSSEPLPDNSTREIRYVVTSGKLEVKISGVRFTPLAKAVRVGGGWGVDLTVTGVAEDEKMHSLLQPKQGALSLAGKIERKGGKTETLSDKRDGDEEVFISPGTPMELTRKWPGKSGMKPLAAGDKVELHVGLWGMGADAATRRPVKKFLIVTLVVGQAKPHAIVAPPE